MPPPRRLTLVLAGLWVVCAGLAVVSFLTSLKLGTIRMSGSLSTWDAARSQLTPWIVVILLTPALVWWCSRFPPVWQARSAVAHLAGLAGFGIFYVVLNLILATMLQSRDAVLPTAAVLGGRIVGSAVLITAKYTIVVVATAAAFYFRESAAKSREAERLERARTELERDLSLARLHLLRTQLQPHFLFNALNAVSGLIEEDPAAARRAVARIGDLLRLVLDRAERTTMTLGEELDFTDRYVDIERVRLGDRLRVRYDVPDELLGAVIPGFAIQPLVENAVRHGIARRPDGGAVDIVATSRAHGIEIAVTNDTDRSAPSGPERIGLGTLRARLAGMYGSRAALDTGPRPGGRFSVVLTIPRE